MADVAARVDLVDDLTEGRSRQHQHEHDGRDTIHEDPLSGKSSKYAADDLHAVRSGGGDAQHASELGIGEARVPRAVARTGSYTVALIAAVVAQRRRCRHRDRVLIVLTQVIPVAKALAARRRSPRMHDRRAVAVR